MVVCGRLQDNVIRSVISQERGRKDTMINFDVYRHNPKAAATLIAREGYCSNCPMYEKCGAAPTHDYDKCFEMWMRFFKFSTETLGSVDDFSEILSIMIDCEKCTIKELYKCDFRDIQDCGVTFFKWLCKDISTCQENRQVEESDSVNHPQHYKLMPGVEVIDVIFAVLSRADLTPMQTFDLGNVLKYMLRADQKNGVQDYEKAAKYLDWLIKDLRGSEDGKTESRRED